MWYGFVLLYYCLLGVLLYCKYRKGRTAVLIAKALTSLGFVAAAWLACRENPGAGWYAGIVIAALGLSLAGDVCLVYGDHDKALAGGFTFFLLAHIVYGAAFSLLSGPSVWDAIFFILLAVTGILIQQYANVDLGRWKLPALIYLLAISYMAAQAFSLCTAMGPGILPVMAGLGALLFYASDGILVWDRFHKPFKAATALNLLCYYTAQLLLAMSIRFVP